MSDQPKTRKRPFVMGDEAKKASQLALAKMRGGPTEDEPDRPYCKDDQTCCDFVCGN